MCPEVEMIMKRILTSALVALFIGAALPAVAAPVAAPVQVISAESDLMPTQIRQRQSMRGRHWNRGRHLGWNRGRHYEPARMHRRGY